MTESLRRYTKDIVMGRIVAFLVLFVVGSVFALIDSTLVNLNKGSQVALFVNDINYPVKVRVLSCTEYGPVDIRTGFGYWTHCEVEYRDQYLVSTKATVTRSIVTADDIDTTVDLWVTCNHLHEKCTVGNEPSQLVTFLAILPRTATVPFGWGVLAASAVAFLQIFWPTRKKQNSSLLDTNTVPAMEAADVFDELQGRVVVRFTDPTGAYLYELPPRMEIDGVPVKVPDWGEHEFPVEPGSHSVKVWIPYVMSSKVSRANAEVQVPVDGRVELEYLSSRWTIGKGSLGAPNE